MKLGIVDVLQLAGFDPSKRTKLVRHQSKYDSVEELIRNEWLEVYQGYQAKKVFHNVEQIISFYGLSNNRAGFYGVYRVNGNVAAKVGPGIVGCPAIKRWQDTCNFFYTLERDARFNEFRDRIIIEWGRGALAWQQKLRNKPLFEMLPAGRKLEPFSDFLEFSLSYQQLQDLFANEEAHRDWKIPLSNVAGVYLILAQKTGDLYIGSACGASGIWGRWKNYTDSGHGDNVKLKKLIQADHDYPKSFRFSVLHILPRTMSREEVIQREKEYKIKLGTRAIGLNSN
ncbi:MAG TPA: GIY-YIG nuclease family protein [Terriglobales bacterium]|nr:GIY-YIG nuclease family protein [Terriglobales bacterium]